MDKKISIIKGSKPILTVSIHHQEKKTVEYNKKLHQEENYYSFIYYGPRERCIRDTKYHLFTLINEMLNSYKKIGMISLHRRNLNSRNIKSSLNQAELGTLNGQTLDNLIVENLAESLLEKRLIFDYNNKLNGGEEIRMVHKRFNDPNYQKGIVNKIYSPAENKVQLVQLELNGPNKKNPPSYELVKKTGEEILNYMKK